MNTRPSVVGYTTTSYGGGTNYLSLMDDQITGVPEFKEIYRAKMREAGVVLP